MPTSPSQHMKNRRKGHSSADRPIKHADQDKLSRSGFAAQLAKDIASWRGDDSLVIALYGSWGAGKTSVKNLVLESLRRSRRKLPVLEFNPWQFSGTGGIAGQFFHDLGVSLAVKQTEADDPAERSTRLSQYSKTLTLGGLASKAMGTLLLALGYAEGGVVYSAGEGMGKAGEVTKAGAEALPVRAQKTGTSTSELKEAVSTAMRHLKKPLLVVIDDIDRLTTAEILEVFQLVKANADFPNLIYLLLFERSIVANALNSVSGERGYEFLEKIVQVGYDVPVAEQSALQTVLFDGLNALLGSSGVSRRWDADRWSRLYLDGLRPYFRNLRHVYRFLGSLSFHVEQFRTGNYFEVNPVDLIGLEAIRVFEPTVFERLPSVVRRN
jgi:predicted KAP-like P-loop ATPase